jgi:hypothetical protein
LFALGEPLGFGDNFKDNKELQYKFIASLELPVYHDFSTYQYLDVLDALSFRIMVIDKIKSLSQDENQININYPLKRQKTFIER